jgi:hypothetical protein
MHRISFKPLTVLASLLAMACLVATARAAISVGSAGAGPLTFDTLPTGTDFLTGNLAGNGATFLTPQDIDDLVLDLASTDFGPTLILASTPVMPPAPFGGQFQHNSTGHFLQSRPTGNAILAMLATLQNDTGADQSAIVVSYDMGVSNAMAGELPGYRVYFSVSGAAGSWVLIPEMSGIEVTANLSANLNLGNWPSGGQMFLVWFDDNANGITDPGYVIDNLTIGLGSGPKVPVQITGQGTLTNLTLAEHQSLTYSISATGNPIQYQWFHDGVPIDNGTNCVNGHDRIITGARSATLRISSVEPLDSGSYHCEVSNTLNSESSVAAALTVTPDTASPTILFAYPGGNANEVIVVFSEPMNDSCSDVLGVGALSDPSNWSLEDVGGGPLGVAGFTNATNLRGQATIGLMLLPETPHNSTLPLRITILVPFTDTAAAPNVLTAGTYRVVTPLIPMDQLWSYDDEDIDPGSDWFVSDPGTFPMGPGPFDAKRDGGIIHANGLDDCRPNAIYDLGPVGTCLALQSPATLTNLITAYFWTHFNFSADLSNNDLFLIGKADDGAVVYLNGSEVQRIRMPAAPTAITHTTFADVVIADGEPRDTILIGRPPGLLAGDNLLALSLHQGSLVSSDLTMGYQVYAIEPSSGVRVNITVSSGNPVISWTPAVGRLEFKNNLTDPAWSVLSTSNPFTDTSGEPHRFYRVFIP